MRSIITLAFIAVLTLTAAAQKADETAAIGVVNQLFAEMEAANPAGILALHTPTSDLVARKIAEHPMALYCSRDYAARRGVPAALEAYNANYIGGDISGGVQHFGQLFTRPAVRFDPYSTPNKRLYICSSSSPPGGGVHGMSGYFAARAALKRM